MKTVSKPVQKSKSRTGQRCSLRSLVFLGSEKADFRSIFTIWCNYGIPGIPVPYYEVRTTGSEDPKSVVRDPRDPRDPKPVLRDPRDPRLKVSARLTKKSLPSKFVLRTLGIPRRDPRDPSHQLGIPPIRFEGAPGSRDLSHRG